MFYDLPGIIETTNDPNSCFIETMLTDLTKEIFCDKAFEDLFTENIDNQPLGLFEWTTEKTYPSQTEVRKMYLDNVMTHAAQSQNESKETAPMFKRNIMNTSKIETKGNHRYHTASSIKPDELKDKIVDAKIESDVMGSDHCPIELDIVDLN